MGRPRVSVETSLLSLRTESCTDLVVTGGTTVTPTPPSTDRPWPQCFGNCVGPDCVSGLCAGPLCICRSCLGADCKNGGCSGSDCVVVGCIGADCINGFCTGPNCETNGCIGSGCGSDGKIHGSNDGDDHCHSFLCISIGCVGPDCGGKGGGGGGICTGPSCSIVGCTGPDCLNGGCVGPQCDVTGTAPGGGPNAVSAASLALCRVLTQYSHRTTPTMSVARSLNS